jgi:glycosyltransferase involved in cell wall biosynthesis
MKICHITSVHQRYDTRIFLKMCCSLAKNGNEVTLLVADGLGNEIKTGIQILDIGSRSPSRVSRMINTVRKIYKRAVELDIDIYHLHDPELIPLGLKLKKSGKKVIFDAHEDLSKQIFGKPYLNNTAKHILSKTAQLFENWVCPKFDVIIAATPSIEHRFLDINPNTVVINNYPKLNELSNTINWDRKKNEVAYVGGITKIRGIKQVVIAMETVAKIRLNLAGKFMEKSFEREVKDLPGWSNVNELGFLNRQKTSNVLEKSKVGIVTFLNSQNHIDAQPNKMFEYMSAGIPIITSNFDKWKEIVEGNQCGICVDPNEPEEIKNAIQYLVDNNREAEEMGRRGRKAVENKYNWEAEEQNLLKLYAQLVKV